MRITVLVNDAEYQEIKKASGLIPLSAWLRDVGLARAREAVGSERRASPKGVLPENQVVVEVHHSSESEEGQTRKSSVTRPATQVETGPKPKKKCRHGTIEGFNCWQCGGMAQT